MKKILLIVMCSVGLIVFSGVANAELFSFSDQNFLGGASWGTMEITASDADSLQVSYTASTTAVIPTGSQVTGFGFTFVPNTTVPNSVTNPAAGDFSTDQDSLNWTVLANLNAIPNPANGDEFNPFITKFDFSFGVTEGNANNINPPGIQPGQNDVFYLNFNGLGFSLIGSDLSDFIDLTGIRLQSLPENINGGSLFLAGGEPPNAVPEPATMMLLGIGLFGLAGYGRKRLS